MSKVSLVTLKKIEIILGGAQLPAIKGILTEAKASGYTLIPNVSGMGHNGYHEGRLIYNESSSQVMLITVVTEPQIQIILAGLSLIFEQYSGVAFVSDVGVTRSFYFLPGAEHP